MDQSAMDIHAPPVWDETRLREAWACARRQFASKPASIKVRRDRLRRCISLLLAHGDEICAALDHDFGGRARAVSRLTEIYGSVAALRAAHAQVARWARPQPRALEAMLALAGARAETRFEPKGVIGVIAPWNFPVQLCFAPLATVFAAGNVAMVKLPELTPRTNAIIAARVEEFFEPGELTIVTGDSHVGRAFSSLPFDHLLFTGGPRVGRQVMAQAAINLTPVTLELGGKSPVFIADDADLASAAARVLAGKVINAGQICLAPDYVLIARARRDAFVAELRRAAAAFNGRFATSSDYTAIISAAHYDRLQSMLAEAHEAGALCEVLTNEVDIAACAANRRIAPTIVLDAPEQAAVLRDEIFGPLLPIVAVDSWDEATTFANARGDPLALYVFGRSRSFANKITRHVRSGGVTFNDVIFHGGVDDLPLGGVGASGMGAYHGFRGFREFSHERAFYHQSIFDLGRLMRPPLGKMTDLFLDAALRAPRRPKSKTTKNREDLNDQVRAAQGHESRRN